MAMQHSTQVCECRDIMLQGCMPRNGGYSLYTHGAGDACGLCPAQAKFAALPESAGCRTAVCMTQLISAAPTNDVTEGTAAVRKHLCDCLHTSCDS